MKNRDKDELLNHEADGIREFDNALPRWWLYGFYFTIAFAAVYVLNYHLMPTPMFGLSSVQAEYAAEVEAAKLASANRPRKPGAEGVMALTDAESLAKGEAIFNGQRNLCHTCHRKDMGGLVGPNLTDDLWMHGCTPAEMMKNVTSGFPPKGMLPFGSGQPLNDEELLQVISYVLSKQGTTPPNPKAVDPEREKACK